MYPRCFCTPRAVAYFHICTTALEWYFCVRVRSIREGRHEIMRWRTLQIFSTLVCGAPGYRCGPRPIWSSRARSRGAAPPTAKVQTALGGSTRRSSPLVRPRRNAGSSALSSYELFYKYIIVLQNPFVRSTVYEVKVRLSPPLPAPESCRLATQFLGTPGL